MDVFIPPTGMKFDVDLYVYLQVWKINYVIPSTHVHFNIFHPSRLDGVFSYGKIPARLPRSRLAGQPSYRDDMNRPNTAALLHDGFENLYYATV